MALFTFSTDPGHGWLLVTPAEMRNLGLTEAHITPCSYTSPERDLIALEEDCDAGTFLDEWKAAHPGEEPTFKEVHHDPNPIRSWPRYGTLEKPFGWEAASA
jgi:hypothetical protein